MAELETAGKRLDGAVARLEKALSNLASTGGQSAAEWESERERLRAELVTLKEDHARVSRECTDLQERNEALRRVTDTVSGELDTTIHELAELLES